MSMSLLNKYIDYQIRKRENKTRTKQFVNLSEVKNMHILIGATALNPLQTEQFYQQVYEVADLFQRMDCKIHITVCVKKMPTEAKRFNVSVFDYKQVGLFKRPKEKLTQDFLQIPTDVLINLSASVCYPLEYLAAQSDASLKVAIKLPKRPFNYDFLLHPTDMQSSLVERLKAIFFYLEKIQSK